MLGVAVALVGVGGLPVVVAEVGLGEGHQHADVVGGAEDLLEAEMGAGLAAVVVGVDEVDAEALEALHGSPSPPRRWPRRR